MPAILAALLPALVQNIPSLAKLFGTGTEVADRNVAAAQKVADLVVQATGSVNLQDATEKLTTNPAALKSAKDAIEMNWFAITGEAGGGGISGARKADADATQAINGFWRSPAFWIACSLIPAIYLILVSLLYPSIGGDWTPETRAAIIGSVIGTILGSLTGYYFGSTTTRNRPS